MQIYFNCFFYSFAGYPTKNPPTNAGGQTNKQNVLNLCILNLY